MAQQRYDEFEDQGLEIYFVVAETAQYGTKADANVCKAVRAKYGLTMPVLFDPGNALGSVYGWGGPPGPTGAPNERNLVLGQGGEILFKGHYSSQATVESVIVEALSSP